MPWRMGASSFAHCSFFVRVMFSLMCLSFWTVFVSGKGNFSIVNDSNHAPCRFHFSTNVLPVYEKIALFANEWITDSLSDQYIGAFLVKQYPFLLRNVKT